MVITRANRQLANGNNMDVDMTSSHIQCSEVKITQGGFTLDTERALGKKRQAAGRPMEPVESLKSGNLVFSLNTGVFELVKNHLCRDYHTSLEYVQRHNI